MTKWKYSRKEVARILGISKTNGVILYPEVVNGIDVAQYLFWEKEKAPIHKKKVKRIDKINFGEEYLQMHLRAITDRLNEVIDAINGFLKNK